MAGLLNRKNCRFLIILTLLLMEVTMFGCKDAFSGSYDSMAVYSEAIPDPVWAKFRDYEGPVRRPLILVHGLLGSRLTEEDTGQVMWGDFSYSRFDDEFYRSISHPMESSTPLADIKDNIYPSEFMKTADIKLLGLSFERESYSGMIDMLKKAGYVLDCEELPEGKTYPNLFLFYYDWRRDPVENAAKLHEFIIEKQQLLAKVYRENYDLVGFDLNFDIIAHSMGGLITRYYLMYGDQPMPQDGSLPELNWSGADYVSNVVIVSTPNAGYLDAFLEMVNGLSLNVAAPKIPAAVMASMPSYYSMLPACPAGGVVLDNNNEPVDLFDPNVWIAYGWGLADPKQESTLKILMPDIATPEQRLDIALEHMRKCLKRAKHFTEALAVQAYSPAHLKFCLFAGNALPTSSVAKIVDRFGKVEVQEYSAGDGKVMLSSARYDMQLRDYWDSPIKWNSTIFQPAAHMGITQSYSFGANVLGFLLFTSNLAE